MSATTITVNAEQFSFVANAKQVIRQRESALRWIESDAQRLRDYVNVGDCRTSMGATIAQQAVELAKAEAQLTLLWDMSFMVFLGDQDQFRIALLEDTELRLATSK